jgi:flagellar hook-associated protein 3 FlgL
MTVSYLSSVPLSVDSYATRRNVSYLNAMSADGRDLQRQLATGRASETYSGLGERRLESLNLRGRLSEIEGWNAGITDAQLRLSLMDRAMTQMEKGAKDVIKEAGSVYKLMTGSQTAAQQTAGERLRQAVELLNLEIGGRFLMAGRASDTRPVADASAILDGTMTQAGLKTLVSERKQADLGAGTGRLAIASTATAATVSEEAAGLPFGMKLTAGSSTSSNVTVAGPAGSPPTQSFTFAGQPADGETVTIRLAMPDGTFRDTIMVAKTAPDSTSANPVFLIGADVAATVANFTAALTTQVQTQASTTLAAASAIAASRDFFAGTATTPPRRVAGPPFASATAFTAGTAANTVVWYKGEDAADNPALSANPRDTALVKVDGGSPVGIGVRANEPGFREMMAHLAVMASESFSAADPNATARYTELSNRVASGLKAQPTVQSLQDIHTQLGYASAAMKASSDRHADSKKILGEALSGIEDADNTTVVAALLTLQTRMEASYQTTSMLSKLSLVNYLG